MLVEPGTREIFEQVSILDSLSGKTISIEPTTHSTDNEL
jgi:hypothetical protein